MNLNNFNQNNIQSTTTTTTTIGNNNIITTCSDDISHIQFSTDSIGSNNDIDFFFPLHANSTNIAEWIDDFHDFFIQYDSNQLDISNIQSIDTPLYLSPELFPFSPLNLSQPFQDDIPDLSLPPPSFTTSPPQAALVPPSSTTLYTSLLPSVPQTNSRSSNPLPSKENLQIPMLPAVDKIFLSKEEQKKEYRRIKYLKFLKKKKLRTKLKSLDFGDVRYHTRQTAASKRQRVNGKFARECPVFIPANKF